MSWRTNLGVVRRSCVVVSVSFQNKTLLYIHIRTYHCIHMDVSENSRFYPQIIHLFTGFSIIYQPSILGAKTTIFGNTYTYILCWATMLCFAHKTTILLRLWLFRWSSLTRWSHRWKQRQQSLVYIYTIYIYIYIYINYTFVTYLEPVRSLFFMFGAPPEFFNEGPYSPMVLNDRWKKRGWNALERIQPGSCKAK